LTEPARQRGPIEHDEARDTLQAMLPRVRRWLYRLLGPTPDLDDATQDALVELARFLPRFEGRSKLETAAHRITVRVAYRYFRRRDAGLDVVPEPVDPTARPDAQMAAREALVRLQRCLQRLPAKRRVAFTLCAIEGLSPADAAEIAETTALAMRCRLLWARREIARMLAHDPYVGPWLLADEEAV
jgi:RNA polymerase sigma-70 factor (ECF subfamily)